jgi:hypothetical protein
MTKHTLKFRMRKVLFLSASFLLLFQACKKDGALNPEFAENTTQIFFSDSTKIQTRTIVGDTILADNISTGLVGVYKDSVFGISTAKTVVQPLLESNSLVFGEPNDILITDSVVLSLEYDGKFGNVTISQTIEVYQVDELLDSDNSYYSNTIVQTKNSILGTKTFIPNLDSNVKVNSFDQVGGSSLITLDPQLRIKLDNSIGDDILAQSGSSTVASSENFIQYFKGLEISSPQLTNPNNYENSILYFALTSSNTKMTIYYKAIGTDTIHKSVDFPINTSSVRFNTFSHDYKGTPVEQSLQKSTDSLFSYTLSMAGVQTVIKFPDLKSNLENQQIAINKAELVIPSVGGSYLTEGFTPQLTIASKNEAGEFQFIPDYFEGDSHFGGHYDNSNNSYEFNITRYVQGLINGTENEKGLTVLVAGSAIKADRTVIYAPGNPSNKIRLNLYYSNTK